MFNKIFFIVVFIGVLLFVFGKIFYWLEIIMFVVYCVMIIVLVGFMGRVIESLVIVFGFRIGGLLNVIFGNVVEFIILIFVF